MSIEVIFGGLIGSIATVIVTKILDMIQRGKEHKYSLQKSFFEKKLQAAAAAVAEWYSTAYSLGGLAALYEQMSTQERELQYEVFKSISDPLSSKLQQISEASNQIANSVFLYFDIEDSTFWDYEPFKMIVDCLSQISAVDMNMKVALDFYDKVKGTEHEDLAWRDVQTVGEQYRSHFKELSDLLAKGHKEMVSLLRKIRMEMKKYEG